MQNALFRSAWIVLLAVALASQANAATMTFDGLADLTTPTTHTEDGITITADSPVSEPSGNVAHFDVYGAILGGSAGDNIAGIHTGNRGETVTFTYNGGSAFDLLSVDITGWFEAENDPTGGTPATFMSSSGANFEVDKGTTGVIDFASMVGWSNIVSFSLAMPFGANSFTCVSSPSNCTIVGFDDVTVQAASAVPLPAALPLFGTGLAAIALVGRRRRRRAAAA